MRSDTTAASDSHLRRLVWQLLLLAAFGIVLAVGSTVAGTPDAAYAAPPGSAAAAPGDPDDGSPEAQPPAARDRPDVERMKGSPEYRKLQKWLREQERKRQAAKRREQQDSPTALSDRNRNRSRPVDPGILDRDRDWRGKATVVRDPVTGRRYIVYDDPLMAPQERDARAGGGSEDWDPPGVKRAEPSDDDPPSREDRERDRNRRRDDLARDPRPVTDAANNVANTLKNTTKGVDVKKPGQPAPSAGDAKSVVDPVSNAAVAATTAVAAANKHYRDRKNARSEREQAGKVDARTLRDSRKAARAVDTNAVNKAVQQAADARKGWQDARQAAQDAHRRAREAERAAKKDPTPHNKARAAWTKLDVERTEKAAERARKASVKADDRAHKVGQKYVTAQGVPAKERAYEARRAADTAEKKYQKAQQQARQLQAEARKATTAGRSDAGEARRKADEARRAARDAGRKYDAANRSADDAERAVRNINERARKSLQTRQDKADLRNGVTPAADAKGKSTRRNGGDDDPGDAARPVRAPKDNGPKGGTDTTGKVTTPADQPAKDGKTRSRSTTTTASTTKKAPTTTSTGRQWALKKQQALDARDATQLRPSVKTPVTRADRATRPGSKVRVRGGPRGGVGAEIITWHIFEHGFPEQYAEYEKAVAQRDQKILDETRRALQDPEKRKRMLQAYEWTKKNRPEALNVMGPPEIVDARNDLFDEALREDRRNGPQTVRTEEQEHGNRRPVVTVRTEEQEHGNRRPVVTVRTEEQEHGNRRPVDEVETPKRTGKKPVDPTLARDKQDSVKKKPSTVRTEEQEHGNRRPAARAETPKRTGKKPVDPTLARDKQDSVKKKPSTVRTEEQEHGNRRPAAQAEKPKKKSDKSSDPAAEQKRKAALKKQDMPA